MNLTSLSKLFSLALAFIFTVQNGLAYAPEANIWAERRKTHTQLARLPVPLPQPFSSISSSPHKVTTFNRNGINPKIESLLKSIPAAYGDVRKVTAPKSGQSEKTIIYIQDVHLNEEAQNNIANAIQDLINKEQIDLLGLEGAFGPIDVAPFRSFSDQEALRQVADYFLKTGKIAGPLYATLTSKKTIPVLVGVDDRKHYDANVNAYRKSTKESEHTKEAFAKHEQELMQEKKAVFSPDLFSFDRVAQSFHDEEQSIGDYVQTLTTYKKDISTPVRVFLEALDLESSLDFRRVERERSHLLSELLEKLDKDAISHLMNRSVAYRLGRMHHSDFYQYLKDLCDKNKILLSRFPAMQSYLQYVLLSDGIDVETLLNDVKILEEAVYADLIKTPDEQTLYTTSKQMRRIRKLIDFSLTPEEWEAYKKQKKGTPAGEARFTNLALFETFYEEAEARDEAIARNISEALERHQSHTAILVTGGFHAKGINRILKEERTTVITYVPKITKVEDQKGSAYLSVFTREKTPLEKIFSGQKLFVPPEVFPQALPGEAAAGLLAYKEATTRGDLTAAEERTLLQPFVSRFGLVGFIRSAKYVANGIAVVFVGRRNTVAQQIKVNPNGVVESWGPVNSKGQPYSPTHNRIALALGILGMFIAWYGGIPGLSWWGLVGLLWIGILGLLLAVARGVRNLTEGDMDLRLEAMAQNYFALGVTVRFVEKEELTGDYLEETIAEEKIVKLHRGWIRKSNNRLFNAARYLIFPIVLAHAEGRLARLWTVVLYPLMLFTLIYAPIKVFLTRHRSYNRSHQLVPTFLRPLQIIDDSFTVSPDYVRVLASLIFRALSKEQSPLVEIDFTPAGSEPSQPVKEDPKFSDGYIEIMASLLLKSISSGKTSADFLQFFSDQKLAHFSDMVSHTPSSLFPSIIEPNLYSSIDVRNRLPELTYEPSTSGITSKLTEDGPFPINPTLPEFLEQTQAALDEKIKKSEGNLLAPTFQLEGMRESSHPPKQAKLPLELPRARAPQKGDPVNKETRLAWILHKAANPTRQEESSHQARVYVTAENIRDKNGNVVYTREKSAVGEPVLFVGEVYGEEGHALAPWEVEQRFGLIAVPNPSKQDPQLTVTDEANQLKVNVVTYPYHGRVLHLLHEEGFTVAMKKDGRVHAFFGSLSQSEIAERVPGFDPVNDKFDNSGRALEVKGAGTTDVNQAYLEISTTKDIGTTLNEFQIDAHAHGLTFEDIAIKVRQLKLREFLQDLSIGNSLTFTMNHLNYIISRKTDGYHLLRLTEIKNRPGSERATPRGVFLNMIFQNISSEPPGTSGFPVFLPLDFELSLQKNWWQKNPIDSPGEINLEEGVIPLGFRDDPLPSNERPDLVQTWRVGLSDPGRLSLLNAIYPKGNDPDLLSNAQDVISMVRDSEAFFNVRGRGVRATLDSGLAQPSLDNFIENDRSLDGKWHDFIDLTAVSDDPHRAREQKILTIAKELDGLVIFFLFSERKESLELWKEFLSGFFHDRDAIPSGFFEEFVSELNLDNPSYGSLSSAASLVLELLSERSKREEVAYANADPKDYVRALSLFHPFLALRTLIVGLIISLHELRHYIVAWLLGGNPRFESWHRVEFTARSDFQEKLILQSGPVVDLLLSFALLVVAILSGIFYFQEALSIGSMLLILTTALVFSYYFWVLGTTMSREDWQRIKEINASINVAYPRPALANVSINTRPERQYDNISPTEIQDLAYGSPLDFLSELYLIMSSFYHDHSHDGNHDEFYDLSDDLKDIDPRAYFNFLNGYGVADAWARLKGNSQDLYDIYEQNSFWSLHESNLTHVNLMNQGEDFDGRDPKNLFLRFIATLASNRNGPPSQTKQMIVTYINDLPINFKAALLRLSHDYLGNDGVTLLENETDLSLNHALHELLDRQRELLTSIGEMERTPEAVTSLIDPFVDVLIMSAELLPLLEEPGDRVAVLTGIQSVFAKGQPLSFVRSQNRMTIDRRIEVPMKALFQYMTPPERHALATVLFRRFDQAKSFNSQSPLQFDDPNLNSKGSGINVRAKERRDFDFELNANSWGTLLRIIRKISPTFQDNPQLRIEAIMRTLGSEFEMLLSGDTKQAGGSVFNSARILSSKENSIRVIHSLLFFAKEVLAAMDQNVLDGNWLDWEKRFELALTELAKKGRVREYMLARKLEGLPPLRSEIADIFETVLTLDESDQIDAGQKPLVQTFIQRMNDRFQTERLESKKRFPAGQHAVLPDGHITFERPVPNGNGQWEYQLQINAETQAKGLDSKIQDLLDNTVPVAIFKDSNGEGEKWFLTQDLHAEKTTLSDDKFISFTFKNLPAGPFELRFISLEQFLTEKRQYSVGKPVQQKRTQSDELEIRFPQEGLILHSRDLTGWQIEIGETLLTFRNESGRWIPQTTAKAASKNSQDHKPLLDGVPSVFNVGTDPNTNLIVLSDGNARGSHVQVTYDPDRGLTVRPRFPSGKIKVQKTDPGSPDTLNSVTVTHSPFWRYIFGLSLVSLLHELSHAFIVVLAQAIGTLFRVDLGLRVDWRNSNFFQSVQLVQNHAPPGTSVRARSAALAFSRLIPPLINLSLGLIGLAYFGLPLTGFEPVGFMSLAQVFSALNVLFFVLDVVAFPLQNSTLREQSDIWKGIQDIRISMRGPAQELATVYSKAIKANLRGKPRAQDIENIIGPALSMRLRYLNSQGVSLDNVDMSAFEQTLGQQLSGFMRADDLSSEQTEALWNKMVDTIWDLTVLMSLDRIPDKDIMLMVGPYGKAKAEKVKTLGRLLQQKERKLILVPKREYRQGWDSVVDNELGIQMIVRDQDEAAVLDAQNQINPAGLESLLNSNSIFENRTNFIALTGPAVSFNKDGAPDAFEQIGLQWSQLDHWLDGLPPISPMTLNNILRAAKVAWLSA